MFVHPECSPLNIICLFFEHIRNIQYRCILAAKFSQMALRFSFTRTITRTKAAVHQEAEKCESVLISSGSFTKDPAF